MTNWCSRCEKKIDEKGHVCFDKQPKVHLDEAQLWQHAEDEVIKEKLKTFLMNQLDIGLMACSGLADDLMDNFKIGEK